MAAARSLRQRETNSERILWNALRDRRFKGRKFRRQSRVGSFVVDFSYAAEGLVVEVDGAEHNDQRTEDVDRQTALEAMGLRVVRVTAQEVERHLEGALDRIRRSLTPTFGHPSPSGRGRGASVRQ
ncbi:MAG: DUF559 domain-containing protein [Dehalococcoidia bacterium]